MPKLAPPTPQQPDKAQGSFENILSDQNIAFYHHFHNTCTQNCCTARVAEVGSLSARAKVAIRGERYIETIASLDQWSITIENHWSQWLKDPKTIEKPFKPMVWGLEII